MSVCSQSHGNPSNKGWGTLLKTTKVDEDISFRKNACKFHLNPPKVVDIFQFGPTDQQWPKSQAASNAENTFTFSAHNVIGCFWIYICVSGKRTKEKSWWASYSSSFHVQRLNSKTSEVMNHCCQRPFWSAKSSDSQIESNSSQGHVTVETLCLEYQM